MKLNDIPMPDLIVNGQTIKRRLLVSGCEFERISWKAKQALLLVEVFHFTEEKRLKETATPGEPIEGQGPVPLVRSATQITVEVPYEVLGSTMGLKRFRVPVLGSASVDSRTGRTATADTPATYKMDEFGYFRMLLWEPGDGGQGMALETLMMSILGRNVEEGIFDRRDYEVVR